MGPIFNKNELMENFKGDEDILLDLIENFLERKNEILNIISISINTKNASELRQSAHRLKGTISNFYSIRLSEICSDLEKRGESNNFENIELVYNDLISNIENLCFEIQKLKLELSTSLN